MANYSKLNIVYLLQRWMDSVPGQTFLNYAYSWGASVVILGTLFKLTHLPGANIMLFLGMGTEVVVFFLSAFDRPFDKTAIGMELPTHLDDEADTDEPEAGAGDAEAQPAIAGGVIVAGGSGIPVATGEAAAVAPGTAAAAQGQVIVLGGAPQIPEVPADAEDADKMKDAQEKYVEELTALTEALAAAREQSARLATDSEEMQNLNRTLTGISRVYEMQLKGATTQIGTMDQIIDQSRKMAEQIAELNKIYARMIEAMTVNMPGGVKS